MNQGVTTEWKKGSAVDVKWANHANHAGGYSYRLCKKPNHYSGLTEACFQGTPLDFYGSTQWIEYVKTGKRVEITAMDTQNGTFPVGSMWRRNPIPVCNYRSWRGGPCLPGTTTDWLVGTMFPPPEPLDGSSWGLTGATNNVHFGYGPFEDTIVADKVWIPEDLEDGEYVLSFRNDCEQYAQVWSSCSNVRITGGGGGSPSPPDDGLFACASCAANGYSADGCGCGHCGSFGACTFSCDPLSPYYTGKECRA